MSQEKYRRRLVTLLWFASFLLVPLLLNLLQAPTAVTVGVDATGKIYSEVVGTRLDLPPDVLPRAGLPSLPNSWRISAETPQNPDTSLYWQPAFGTTFSLFGKVGEWAQSLRPSPHWENGRLTEGAANGVISYTATLIGGRTPADIKVEGTSPSTQGRSFEFEIRPERRSIAWWRLENGQQVEQVAGGSYRPRGRVSSADVVAELVLVAAAANLLAFIAWLANWLASARVPETQADNAAPRKRRLPSLPRLPHYAVPLALLFAATLTAVAACLIVLGGIPHVQDDVGYIFQARIFAMARSWVPTPPGPEFFANGFIEMVDGRWFAKYPPGYPLMLAPAFWAGIPWLINPLSAGVAVALVYLAGRRMYGVHVAVWAALLGVISPWVIFMSGSYMSHPTTMMWVALFLYCTVRLREPATGRDSRRWSTVWPLLGGFAIGMAFITRQWTAAGIGIGVAVWALGDLVLTPRAQKLSRFSRYALILVGFLPPLLFILYENRQLTGDWLRFAQDLVGSYDQPGFGPGHGDAVGHTPALGVYNALVYLRTLSMVFDGWPAPLALAPIALGCVAWVGEKTRKHLGWDSLLWLGTLGLVGAYFVWWASTTIYGPRYWYEAMPFLLLIGGRGLDLLGRIASWRLKGLTGVQMRWAVPAAVFALLSLYALTQSLPYQAGTYVDYNGISAGPIKEAERARLANALVFVQLDPAKPNRDYGKVFFANDPLLRGNIVYARDLGAKRNAGLLPAFLGRKAYWLPLEGPPVPGFGPSP